MRRQSLGGFILLNIFVTFAVTLTIIAAYTRLAPAPAPLKSPPLQVIITATRDPNGAESVRVVIVTATPGASTLIPLTPNASISALTIGAVPTLDPSLLPSAPPAQSATPEITATGPGGCQVYTVAKGDFPGVIADKFGVSLANLYKANGLKVDPVLSVGQKLIIPVNGCGLFTETPTVTATPAATETPPPTSTLAPTAAKTSISILEVIKAGDITEEGVQIANISDGVVDLTGWTLANAAGETYKFPNYRMFPNGKVLISTRSGPNSASVLYWGKATAQWGGAGQKITLKDSAGVIQATFSTGS